MVPALVLPDSGKLVRGLGASDFRLSDNGIEQKISVEVAEPQSLAVVVLIQTGGTAPRHFKDYRKLGAVIENMIGMDRTRHPTFGFISGSRSASVRLSNARCVRSLW